MTVIRPAALVARENPELFEDLTLPLPNGQTVHLEYISGEMAESIERAKEAHPHLSAGANLRPALELLLRARAHATGPASIRMTEKIRELDPEEGSEERKMERLREILRSTEGGGKG
ncbi:MAG: hypothetical protein FJ149_09415 [Euryarchaeota archaeon]|nr:hypothetical protein [Euryarchaeota archaeon]